MNNERDLLKSLLLKEELKLLDQLKEKVLSQEQFTEEVSKVLSRAIKRAQTKNPDFERALSAPIQKGVSRAFTQNKQAIVDGLLPIMGQLIRKTVANSIKQFVTDINRTIEEGYSIKALRWRWQAKKAGITYPEMLFQKTIKYQVKELFLISRENGLLIEHVGTSESLKDNNSISAMLTVIQDFIRDSFNDDGANLENVSIKDVEYIIVSGPKAYIASVVKGSPTGRLKEKTQKLIENVHAEFSDSISKEELYQTNPDLQYLLQSHLITKSISDKQKTINWLPWIVVVSVLVASLAYWTYQRNVAFNKIANAAKSIEGLYFQSISRQDGKYRIRGLVDPLADVGAINTNETVLEFEPFISLDDGIIKKRVSNILSNYKGYNAKINKGTITLTGFETQKTNLELIRHLENVAGINHVKNNVSIDSKKIIQDFVEHFFESRANNVQFEILQNKLFFTGSLDFKSYNSLLLQLKGLFPNVKIQDESLTITDSSESLINTINNTQINLPLLDSENIKQIQNKQNIIKSLQSLMERKAIIKLSIIGESDCHGSLSNHYSENRAQRFMEVFIQKGIDKSILFTGVKTCADFNGSSDDSKLNVSFKVIQ